MIIIVLGSISILYTGAMFCVACHPTVNTKPEASYWLIACGIGLVAAAICFK